MSVSHSEKALHLLQRSEHISTSTDIVGTLTGSGALLLGKQSLDTTSEAAEESDPLFVSTAYLRMFK